MGRCDNLALALSADPVIPSPQKPMTTNQCSIVLSGEAVKVYFLASGQPVAAVCLSSLIFFRFGENPFYIIFSPRPFSFSLFFREARSEFRIWRRRDFFEAEGMRRVDFLSAFVI